MQLVSRKGILAIAAVIDVATHAHSRPVSAKALAVRHQLPSRHLEPVLQALVRDGILKGIRGPHGGYEIARDQTKITAEDILHSAGSVEESEEPLPQSDLVGAVVQPALALAERTFSAALRQITVADMARQASNIRVHDLDSFDAIPLEAKVQ
jgi:Rrf2 family iron-sulfur cluster assembly transcriptional regulator